MNLNWKPPKVFYGWWVVGASFLIVLYTGGAVFFGFTAFFKPIAEEFGWSYAQTSIAASIRGIEVGLLAPILGILVDRWGSRRLVFGGAVIGGLGLILISRITSLGTYYGAYFLLAAGMSGLTYTVLLPAIVNWFDKNVGLATGIVVSGVALGSLLVPVTTMLIDTFGWQTATIIIGIGLWAIGLPLSMFFKRRTAQYHHISSSDMESSAIADNGFDSAQIFEAEFKANQVLKSRTFWSISLVFIYYSIVMSAVVTHVMPYLSSIGISRSTSSLIATAAPLVSIIGRLGIGWLGDRFDKRRLAAACIVFMSLGLFFFGQVDIIGLWSLVPFVILFGIGWGGNVTIRVALIREYFGRRKFGTILGFHIGVSLIGGIIGPPLAGWVFDTWGSYQGAWLAFAGLAIVPLAILASVPRVDRVKR